MALATVRTEAVVPVYDTNLIRNQTVIGISIRRASGLTFIKAKCK